MQTRMLEMKIGNASC